MNPLELETLEANLLTGRYQADVEDAMMEFQMFGISNRRATSLNDESREYRRVVDELFDLKPEARKPTEECLRPRKLEPLPLANVGVARMEIKTTLPDVSADGASVQLIPRQRGSSIKLAPIGLNRKKSRRSSLPNITNWNQLSLPETMTNSRSFPDNSLHFSQDLPVIREDITDGNTWAESNRSPPRRKSIVGRTFPATGRSWPEEQEDSDSSRLRPRRHSIASGYTSNNRGRRHSCQMNSVAWEDPSAKWKIMIHKRTRLDDAESDQLADKKGYTTPLIKPTRASTKLTKLKRGKTKG